MRNSRQKLRCKMISEIYSFSKVFTFMLIIVMTSASITNGEVNGLSSEISVNESGYQNNNTNSSNELELLTETTTEVETVETTTEVEQPVMTEETTVLVEPVIEETTMPTRFTDICNKSDITKEDMDEILEYYYSINETPFYGHSDIFIEAAEQSGLSPIYILAHAATESGWGKNHMGERYNYFGIGAYDADPEYYSLAIGNDMRTGIINGACWISDNYYAKGRISLHSMIYDGPAYASAADDWINTINSIMVSSYDRIYT